MLCIKERINRRTAEGVSYSTVCFVGNGSNNECPSFVLPALDYVLSRLNYALEHKSREDNPNFKAKIFPKFL